MNKKLLNLLLLKFHSKPFDRRTLESDVRFSTLEVIISGMGGGGGGGVTKVTEARETADGNRDLCYPVIVGS